MNSTVKTLLLALALMLATLNPATSSSPPGGKRTEDDDNNNNNDVTASVAETAVGAEVGERTAAEPTVKKSTGKQQQQFKQHNAKLLGRLGMKRVRTNVNNHRKRLASQSRSKYATAGDKGAAGMDSQLFMVKLPPHAYFYDETRRPAAHNKHQQQQQHASNALNTIPLGFLSNGKPAKVYHWNLPTVRKALQGRYKSGADDDFSLLRDHHADYEPSASKILPRRTLYYKPKAAGKPVKKSFVNNGKPNGFYVVSKNNVQQPQFHKIVKTYYGDGD